MAEKPNVQEQNSPVIESSLAFYRKSNRLINSKGRSSALCLRLFAVGITRAKESPDGSKIVSEISGQELRKLFGRTNGSFYDQVKALIKPVDDKKPSILDWRLYLEDNTDNKKKIEGYNIITKASFSEGKLELQYNSELKNDLLNLQTNYTVLSIAQIMALTNSYAIQIWEMLSSELNLEIARRKRNTDPAERVSVSKEHPFIKQYDYHELRQLLGLSKPVPDRNGTGKHEMLASVNDFKKRCLEPARIQICERTSLHMDYDLLRSGRGGKVVGVIFTVYRQDKNGTPEQVDSESSIVDIPEEQKRKVRKEVMMMLMDLADDDTLITSRDAETICQIAGYDENRIRKACDLAGKQKSIKNLVGWLRTAIEKDYDDNIGTKMESSSSKTKKVPKSSGKKKKSDFNDFQQNDYDFDKLEEQLLKK